MLRSVALTLAAVLIARVHEPRMTTAAPGDQDIHQLMTSARNAPAPLCALAVAAVGHYGWGRWSDAPVTPLAPVRREPGCDGTYAASRLGRLVDP